MPRSRAGGAAGVEPRSGGAIGGVCCGGRGFEAMILTTPAPSTPPLPPPPPTLCLASPNAESESCARRL
eukprot:5993433-Prymnesium_polylepis.1